MTQPTAANAKMVDKSNNPQIGDRQVALAADIVVITDSSTGTATNTVDVAISDIDDDVATLAAKINELVVQQNLIIDILEAHGLVANN